MTDRNIARKIVSLLSGEGGCRNVLEVGPGTGILSDLLIDDGRFCWTGIDLDRDSVALLRGKYPGHSDRILEADFLEYDPGSAFKGEPFAIIGNFPYNISSQILFKILEYRNQIPEVVGMFQREVALRIASPPGSKTYGILSVLTQAFYRVRLMFNVEPHVFHPPPRVRSSVILLKARENMELDCDETLFFRVVKTAFNKRRKTLKNSLQEMNVNWKALPASLAGERPERLGVDDFVAITASLGGSAGS